MALRMVVLLATETVYGAPEQVMAFRYGSATWLLKNWLRGVRGLPVLFRKRGQEPCSNPSTCINSWMANPTRVS